MGRYLLCDSDPESPRDAGGLQFHTALERYRKHRDIFSCSELILHMRVEDTRLDPAMSLYLNEQTVVAGLRKTIGE